MSNRRTGGREGGREGAGQEGGREVAEKRAGAQGYVSFRVLRGYVLLGQPRHAIISENTTIIKY